MNCRRAAPLLIVPLVAWLAAAAVVPARAAEQALETQGSIVRGFSNPPSSARPAGYWAWLNGYVDVDRFGWELGQWKEKGLSKAFIFECGARDPEGIVPVGPAFLGPEFVRSVAQAIREAGSVGMELGFTTSSSWNAGGSWVEPKHASMGLFKSEVTVEGPSQLAQVLPLPSLPAKAPKRPDGRPAYHKDIAVLAVPDPKIVPGFEFIFELAPPGPHMIERVVLVNTESDDPQRYGPMHLFAKDFSVAASVTTPDAASFREILAGTLRPVPGAQEFRLAPTPARHLRLTALSGHNSQFENIQLGEFEAYTTEGKNVALEYRPDGTGGGANLLRWTSAKADRGDWSAGNIYDGRLSGPSGSWCSGPPAAFIQHVRSVIDLSSRVDENGLLQWNAPAGKWTIMRFVCSNTGQGLAIPSPKSQGLAIDHFSAQATRMHFQYLIDKLQEAVGPLRDTALSTMYLCSYELRGAAWTPDFLEQFQRRRGYDMTPYLPVIFGAKVTSQEVTERFDYDYRKTQGDLLVDAFYKTAADVCHEHGLLLCAEAGGPGPPTHNVPVDALKAQGVMDIPRGEFWTDLHLWVVKETACASHIYGKKIVDMEAFTGWGHWQHGPLELKPFADRAMCDGTNHFTFHTSPHTPHDAGLPGWVYHAGTHMAPSIAWWPKAGAFFDYLSRSSYLLQQGLFVGDVCYYYGDQAFNFVPPKHVDPSLGPGYDYDVTNAEVILTRMDVRDGRIVLPDGLSYELLVLPERDDIDLDVLTKLEQLVRKGATVVGRKPIRSNGLADSRRRDSQVRRLADRIWGPCDGKTVREHSYGKGTVIWGRDLRDILGSRGLGPDFVFQSKDDQTDLDYLHRRADDIDIYFVSNRTMRWSEAQCTFRVRGKTPELWMPGSGTIRRPAVFRNVAGGTQLPLRLPPAGSVFVVFREPAEHDHLVSVRGPAGGATGQAGARCAIEVDYAQDNGTTLEALAFESGRYTLQTAEGHTIDLDVIAIPAHQEIHGPWTVRFAEGWGAPESTNLERLISWTEHPRQGIRYFSGIATYEKQFDLPVDALRADVRLLLDLGNVKNVADVTLNGKRLGILWKPPFQVDVTTAVQAGSNRLVVEVANTWSNRLVGDALSPEDQRYCRTNMTRSQTWQVPWNQTPLLESGLLGPVRLIPARTIRIELPE